MSAAVLPRVALAQDEITFSSLLNPDLQNPDAVVPAAKPAARNKPLPASSIITEQPPGALPSYGVPAGSSAGPSGFISTNVPSKKPPKNAAGKSAAANLTLSDPPVVLPASAAAARAQRRGAPSETGSVAAPDPDPYAEALARRRAKAKVAPDDDPYAALGWRAGAFLIKPAIEAGAGYDTNPNRNHSGIGSWFYLVSPELVATSDWSRHALNVDLRGSYLDFRSAPTASRPTFHGKVDGRVDVSSATQINLQARYQIATNNPGTPNAEVGVERLPIYSDTTLSAGVTQRFNRLELSGKGLWDRFDFQDSHLTDGTVASNHDEDYNQYSAQLRAGYEVMPGAVPFIGLNADTRQHDLKFDRNGLQRDSVGVTPKIGSSFIIPKVLTGEISIGYTTRRYQDSALQNLSGLVLDSSLVWTPTGLTTVTLTGKSDVNELIEPGASGYLSRDIGLQVDHAFRRWLILTLKAGAGLDTFQSDRSDKRFSASAALTYKLSRSLYLKGEVRHDMLRSNLTGNDYDADAFLLSLRLQR